MVDFLRGTSVVGVVVVEPEGLMGLAHWGAKCMDILGES